MYIFWCFEIYYQKGIVVFLYEEGRGREEWSGVMEVFIVNVLLGGDW